MINTTIEIEQLNALIDERIKEHIEKCKQNWNNDILTEDEACEFLKITRPTLYKLRKEGKVKYTNAGKCFRYVRRNLLNIGE